MCSTHKHDMRYNAFYVESGKLVIEVIKNDYDLTDRTVLTSGLKTVAKSGEMHRFVAIEDTVALEWYWVENMDKDIDRQDHGYMMGDDEFKQIRHEIT